MSLLTYLLSAARGAFVLAAGTSLLGGLGSALLVITINEALAASADKLVWMSFAFAALAIVVPLLRWISQSQFVKLQQFALARLRVLLSTHVAHAPFAQVEGEGAARFLAVLVEDVGTVSDFFVALPRFIMQGAIVFGAFSYLAWLSWQALVFALGLVLLGSLIHFLAVRRASRHLENARTGEDVLYGHFRNLVSGGKELQLSHARREHFLSSTLAPSVESVQRDNTRGFLTYVGAGSWGAFMFFAVIGSVIFGLGSVMDFDRSVRSGYALMFLYTMFPLEDLLEAVPDLVRVRIALGRIREACGGELALSWPAPERHGEQTALASVELRKASHRYRRDADDGVFQLGPLSLRLGAGEVVFLIGGNGSGKTTLAKLFVGLYEPESGHALLDGKLIAQGEREHYRQQFSAVFSDFHLFDGVLGVGPAASEERTRELLRELRLEHKVSVRDGEFSTTSLSSGQRKRLALLVACLEDRPLCVFDEWAADQDPVYKDVFYTRILPALKAQGKGVLVITHDDRYFHPADRCLRLESGQLSAAESLSDPAQRGLSAPLTLGPASP
jgi:putative ATP-binding cassette transporter